MTYTINLPTIGPAHPFATVELAKAYARSRGAQRLADVDQFIVTIWDRSNHMGTRPEIAYGQWCDETNVGKSDYWINNLNPGGLRITYDGERSTTWSDGNTAALGMLHRLSLYIYGYAHAAIPDGAQYDPAPEEVGKKGYLGIAKKLNDLSGRWAENMAYGAQIAGHLNLAFPRGEDAVFTVPVERPAGGTDVATKPLIILAAGHRNTSGGNEEEASWTPALLAAYEAAFTAAGYTVFPIQENDGDSNPTYTNGSLDVVTKIGANRMDSWAGDGVYLDLHYEGSPAPGVFCIVPDGVGLSSVVATPDADSFAGNPLDVALAKTIAGNISAVTGLQLRTSGVVVPGVMSEKQTGVGIDGYRLATMAYTARVRDRLVRLVVEHGNHTIQPDRGIIMSPGFPAKCASAAVAAVSQVYGVPSVPVNPKPEHPKYAKPSIPAWLPDDDGISIEKIGNTRVYPHTAKYRVIKQTPRKQATGRNVNEIGPNLMVGETFDAGRVYRSRDEHGKVTTWVLTQGGSRIRAADLYPKVQLTQSGVVSVRYGH